MVGLLPLGMVVVGLGVVVICVFQVSYCFIWVVKCSCGVFLGLVEVIGCWVYWWCLLIGVLF